MAIRIRVYPQNGLYGGMGGYGGYGRYGLAGVQLQNERRTNQLRLQYERALWAERLKLVQLQTAMQYQQGGWGYPRPMMGGFGNAFMGGLGISSGLGFFNGLGLGGMFDF